MASRGEPWYPGDTINSSIGQGYMWATPLQLATAASIIANEGKVVPPRMLKAVDGELFEPLIENPMPDVMVNDSDYWRYIENAMTMVVHRPFSDQFRDYGTAYESIAMADREMSYKMAGKSGSAQVVGISQDILSSSDIMVSDLNKDHGLFISFAPAQNSQIAPQIAVAVFVENGEHGSSVAGPIAKQVIDTYLLDILKLDFFTVEDAPHSEKQVRASDE
jgi:penicillin-binding protein 2